MKVTVKMQYGQYEGETTVLCDDDSSEEHIKAKARKQLGADFLPMAYESFEIIGDN